MPGVSVVLPCYNEEKEIESALLGLEAQTFADREIIIADDGSTDSTLEIASRVVERRGFKDVRLIEGGKKGVSHARNLGASVSAGEIVFFAECDCVYSPDYIAKAVESLHVSPDAAATCLTGSPLIIRSTIATECINMENRVQHKLLKEGKIEPFYAWVFRREVFNKIGGYDESLTQAEDKDIFKRLGSLGYKVALVAGENWWHKRDQSLSDVADRRLVRAQKRVDYLLKHRLLPELIRSLAPLWMIVAGILLLPVLPWAGGLAIVSIFAAWTVVSLRFAWLAWDVAPKREYLIVYPLVVAVRSLSASIGSSIGLAKHFLS